MSENSTDGEQAAEAEPEPLYSVSVQFTDTDDSPAPKTIREYFAARKMRDHPKRLGFHVRGKDAAQAERRILNLADNVDFPEGVEFVEIFPTTEEVTCEACHIHQATHPRRPLDLNGRLYSVPLCSECAFPPEELVNNFDEYSNSAIRLRNWDDDDGDGTPGFSDDHLPDWLIAF